RMQKFFELLQLTHQRLIDFLSARRIENLYTWPHRRSRRLKRGSSDTLHVLLARLGNMHRDVDLSSKGRELFNSGRPLRIACDERWHVALFFEQQRQLGSRCRLPGAVEPDDQNPCCILEAKWLRIASQ